MKKYNNYVIILLCLTGLIFSSCGSSDTGSGKANETSGQLIVAAEGGTLSYRVPDGTVVTLEIPPKALNKNTTINLTVADESAKTGSDSQYIISTEPEGLKLFDPAYLSISFASSFARNESTGLFNRSETGLMVALKQSATDAQIKGNIYSLGVYDCLTYDTAMCVEMLTAIEDADVPDDWQGLLTVFNGLIWTGNFFHGSGETDDAKACMAAAISICGQGINNYLNRQDINDEKELSVYKNDLEKYTYIQQLCSGQAVLPEKEI